MVWAGITTQHRTNLVIIRGNVTAQRYINDVLQPHLLPFVAQHGPLTFQHDNAPAYRANVTRQFLQQNGINVIQPWPAYSPDLNPIEHLWDKLDREVRSINPPPATPLQLERALVLARNNIPQDFIRNLIHSMRRRCTAVINANGSHTSY